MDGFVCRLRGLPWSATPSDIIKFFNKSEIAGGEAGVHLTFSREGRASGEAFVEFASEEDLERGLEKHNEHMGQRYIEVFRSKKSEMEWVIKRAGSDQIHNMSEAVVKLRGLPFGCSKEEIAQYIEIFKSSLGEATAVVGSQRGSFRPQMGMGRPGPYDRHDRYSSPGGAGMGGPMGAGFNRGRGSRNLKGYFDDDFNDYNGGYGMGFGGRGRGSSRGRMSGGMMDDRGRGGAPGSHYMSKTGHSVHMRGLPFQAGEQDIFDFFSPIQPVRVSFEFGPNGRLTGEANVDFATHQEALEAMKKHRSNMQHRYIELFLNSTPQTRGGSEGGGYNSDMGGGSFSSGSLGGGGGSYGGSGGYGGGNSNNSSLGGGGYGYGMGGSSMNGNLNSSMGGNIGSGYGGRGMSSSYMDSGGGYGSLSSSSMGGMSNSNYSSF
ncbi:hypothetical protein C0Q70_01494 [Pomacea canaliculata]|uniref:RRM domain-containing protein n=1 Tax=Pomacea canaliculata TaxID=400727 RepID=A0A2T7PZN0_POMCA|nr:hypothetical protein C0Q70_01494 [Pomacea canaliculata]